jgi:lysozyme
VRVSEAGAELIAGFEGFVGHPYRDAVGVWTIGFGHTHGVGPGSRPITRQQALELLRRDLDSEYGRPVNALGLPLNQNQFDALVSFVYNCGPGAIAASTTIGKRLRARDWRGAADALLAWDKAGGRVLLGLTRRRRAERSLFLNPVAKPGPAAWLTAKELAMIREYDRLVRSGHAGSRRAAALREQMTAQRKRIWRAAQGADGWTRAHRRERYQSLRARTT